MEDRPLDSSEYDIHEPETKDMEAVIPVSEAGVSILDAIREQLGIVPEKVPNDIKTPHEPGTLHGERPSEDVELKTALSEATKFLNRPVEVAYNPGCGESVSLVSVLPEARTILVDESGDVQHVYIQHNIDNPDRPYEFYRDDMHSFTLPDGIKADLTLILNATYMTQGELNNVVAPGGIVVINDWHSGATFMKAHCPDYQLLGSVDMGDPDVNDLYIFKRQL